LPTQEILDDFSEIQEVHIRAALVFAVEWDAMTKVFVSCNRFGYIELCGGFP
jgi:predicted protein tyrosine phosphatase